MNQIDTIYDVVGIGNAIVDVLAKVGDIIHFKNLILEIISMDGIKVKKILVKKEETEE